MTATTDGVEYWRDGWPTEDATTAPPGVDLEDHRYDFVLKAPLGRALRNHEVTEQHRAWARRMTDALGIDAPTWWHYAGWSSAQVGALLRARIPGNARLARALSVGNTKVYANTAAVAERLVRPVSGASMALPPAGAPPDPALFVKHGAGLALEVYREAVRVAPDDPDRAADLVALGNLCLLAREQEILNEAISVAPRVRIRQLRRLAFIDPRPSLRTWRQEEPSVRWMAFENWLAPKLIAVRPLRMPWGSIRIRDGVPEFRMPEPRPEMPERLREWHPFDFFPPDGAPPACYLDLGQRMRYLSALLWANREPARWAAGLGPTWDGARRERLRVQRVFDRLPEPTWYADRAAAARLPAGLTLPLDRQQALDDEPGDVDQALAILDGAAAQADLEIARRLYRSHRSWVAIAFLARSLPASFTGAEGAALLAPRTSGVAIWDDVDNEQNEPSMAGDAAWRAGRTLAFVDRMLAGPRPPVDDVDAPDPGTADALQAMIATTRMSHHGYRAALDLLADHPTKAGHEAAARLRAQNGRPANVVDAVGTAVAFTASVHQFFQAFLPHAVAAQEDWDAWARTWARITVAIGAPVAALSTVNATGELVMHDMATMTSLGEYIDAISAKPSGAGIYLMENFLGDIEDAVPRWQRRMVRLGVQIFGDERHTTLLMVDVRPVHTFLRAGARAVGRTPGVSTLWRTAVDLVMRPVLRELVGLQGSQEASIPDRFPTNCTTTDVTG